MVFYLFLILLPITQIEWVQYSIYSFLIWFDLIFGVQRHFQQYFSYIMGTSFSGGRSRSTRRADMG